NEYLDGRHCSSSAPKAVVVRQRLRRRESSAVGGNTEDGPQIRDDLKRATIVAGDAQPSYISIEYRDTLPTLRWPIQSGRVLAGLVRGVHAKIHGSARPLLAQSGREIWDALDAKFSRLVLDPLMIQASRYVSGSVFLSVVSMPTYRVRDHS